MTGRSRDPASFFEGVASPRKTAVDLVADAVRKAIESGVLAPGEKVNEEMLAAKFTVSRMPVRQALRALEAEGLIKLVPHSGAIVSQLTADELEELYYLRATLESIAVARAVPRYTAENLLDLRACLQRIDMQEATGEEYVRMNQQFHRMLYAPSGWHRLMQLIDQIGRNVTRYVFMSVAEPDLFARSAQMHWEIIEACEARDVARAQQLIRHHVLQVGEAVVHKVRAMERSLRPER